MHTLRLRVRVGEGSLAGALRFRDITFPEEDALRHGQCVVETPFVGGSGEGHLGQVGLLECGIEVTGPGQDLAGHESRPRVRRVERRLQTNEPRRERIGAEAVQPRLADLGDGFEGGQRLVRAEQKFHGHLYLAASLEGVRGLPLQLTERRLSLVLQVLLPQIVPEQVVIAVGALFPGREREHAIGGQVVQVEVGVVDADDAIGQLGRDVLEATGAPQEETGRGVLSLVDLLGQVGIDVLSESRVSEGGLDRVEIEPLEGESREDDARRPSLSELEQAADVLSRGLPAQPRGEYRGRLLAIETQEVDAQQADLVSQAHPGRQEGRFVPGEDDEADVLRSIGEHVVQGAVERFGVGRFVIVIEEDMEVLVHLFAALVHEQGQHVLHGEGNVASSVQPLEDDVPKRRDPLLKRFDERPQECGRIAVERVQFVPDGVESETLECGGRYRGLAVASGSAYHSESALGRTPESCQGVQAQRYVIKARTGELRRDRLRCAPPLAQIVVPKRNSDDCQVACTLAGGSAVALPFSDRGGLTFRGGQESASVGGGVNCQVLCTIRDLCILPWPARTGPCQGGRVEWCSQTSATRTAPARRPRRAFPPAAPRRAGRRRAA